MKYTHITYGRICRPLGNDCCRETILEFYKIMNGSTGQLHLLHGDKTLVVRTREHNTDRRALDSYIAIFQISEKL